MKFMAVLEAGDSLLWRKVNVMPESALVQFKHQAHIRAEVECATCHGDVSQMTVAQQVINTADMGWCVSCHRENDASIDCLTCHY
jgi:c(7)-type cytochrome triheme protein